MKRNLTTLQMSKIKEIFSDRVRFNRVELEVQELQVLEAAFQQRTGLLWTSSE